MSLDPALKTITEGISGFPSLGHAERIRFFAWFLLAIKNKPLFTTADISGCYDGFGYARPNISQFLKDMAERKPAVLLRRGSGYILEGKVRAEYDTKYLPARDATVKVDKLLADLPGKVPDAAERDFLSEALICFRNKAFRASIVMTWNLTFFHLCTNVLKHKRAEFNAEYPVRYAGIHKKAKAPVIAKIEDFSSDLKESEMIEICRSANIITKEQFNALDRQIGRRNSSAHPSTTVITYLQAEEFIHDLIENVVLTIKI
jgi:hypothetical protein